MEQTSTTKSRVLKLCLFTTGLAGIVAEFILSTLASYLVGDSIFQWSLIISLMLFSMGIGSFLSRFIQTYLLDKFIFTEFSLSIFCALSAGFSYYVAGFTTQVNLIIYFLAIVIGILIGLEIPLVTRINEHYEELRVNISSVMQYDYLGSLFGGLLFSFFALPYLGLTYTPIILGTLNFVIALFLFWRFRELIFFKKLIIILASFLSLILIIAAFVIKPLILYSEQKQYRDKIVYQEQTRYQKIVVTRWKKFYWLFINQNVQFSSYDEWLYHESLVHPAMNLAPVAEQILILGGGDGNAAREVLKYPAVKKVTLVDIDPAMTKLGQTHPLFLEINQGALNHPKVAIVNMDAYQFLREDSLLYDVILIDLPDPNNIELSKLYSKTFYCHIKKHLSQNGVLVTQATDISQAAKTFCCIWKTIEAAGLIATGYHNYVPTMGNWGWIIAVRPEHSASDVELKQKLLNLNFDKISTQFINQEAMFSMFNFGKGIIEIKGEVEVNTELNPKLYQYYSKAYELSL
ncbi:polyamine aminopropyltransferase [candidate division KSB1 bacterium]|nr:polyamine aminopropyltransferase [candidate division KSB1 bacterium]